MKDFFKKPWAIALLASVLLAVCMLLLTLPENDVDPTEPSTLESTDPTDPKPTEPTNSPTEPTNPPTEPTNPPTEPINPPTEPTNPPTEPTNPPTEPTIPPTEPTIPPTEPTNPPTEPPKEYKYDLGNKIDNPTTADIQLFYDMVQNQTLFGPSFHSETASISWLKRIILDDVGSGMFHEYEFSFFEDSVELYNEIDDAMLIYSRYYADDIDWVMMAVFGREADRSQMVSPDGDSYFEGEYFYRFAEEQYMGNPGTWVEHFDTSYQILPNGNWKFTISMETMGEFDEEAAQDNYEIEAIPMHSADVGTYWRIVSFVNLDS